MRNPRLLVLLTALLVGLGLAGCSYYQVTDPHSGKVYYTTSWDRKGEESGVIVFKDAASRATVTLATHEVRKVDKRRFDASVSRQVAEQP
ncbi:MAG: hypothetical protein AAF800_06380 [Planctomycetota bacterium]